MQAGDGTPGELLEGVFFYAHDSGQTAGVRATDWFTHGTVHRTRHNANKDCFTHSPCVTIQLNRIARLGCPPRIRQMGLVLT